MRRGPDRESITGYHRTAWAEWDFGDENKWQNVNRRYTTGHKDDDITIYSADAGQHITIPACEAPSLIAALKSAVEWEKTNETD